MKTIKFIIVIVASLMAVTSVKAQALNWNSLSPTQKHILNLNAGVDYGTSFGIGYGYHVKSSLPLVLTANFSMPAGSSIADDFKSAAGAQLRVYQWRSFCFSVGAQGIFRRYQTEYVRLLNFGSDFSGTVGYYRPHWFVAGQVGFDKAIVTHFKNSPLLADNFPEISNGWYQPSTGGNFYYGLQGGYSFSKTDIYLQAGKVIQQDFKTSPFIPFYARLGVNLKFSSAKD